MFPEIGISFSIMFFGSRFIVRIAINLQNEIVLGAEKICDVRTKRHLSSEFQSMESLCTELPPQHLLCRCLIFSQISRSVCGSLWSLECCLKHECQDNKSEEAFIDPLSLPSPLGRGNLHLRRRVNVAAGFVEEAAPRTGRLQTLFPESAAADGAGFPRRTRIGDCRGR